MALFRGDSIADQSTSTGTGDLVLLGEAPQGFADGGFSPYVPDGATVRVRIQNVDEVNPLNTNLEWEDTEITYTLGSNSISRAATPYASSNAGAKVDFSRTPLAVICVMTAADFNGLTNLDGGTASSIYGGVTAIDAGGA